MDARGTAARLRAVLAGVALLLPVVLAGPVAADHADELELVGSTLERARASIEADQDGLRHVVRTDPEAAPGSVPGERVLVLAATHRPPLDDVQAQTDEDGLDLWSLRLGTPVPELDDLSRDEAEAVLEAAGLEAEAVPTDAPATARATASKPTAGTLVPFGARVAVVLEPTTDQVRVPDLAGRREGPARALLQDAGLEADVAPVEVADEDRQGRVVGQEPDPGELVDRGSTVRIEVGAAPPPPDGLVTVPDVVGSDRDEATSRLDAAGLRADAEPVQVEGDRPEGLVVGQDPLPGRRVRPGSTVVVQVVGAAPVDAGLLGPALLAGAVLLGLLSVGVHRAAQGQRGRSWAHVHVAAQPVPGPTHTRTGPAGPHRAVRVRLLAHSGRQSTTTSGGAP